VRVTLRPLPAGDVLFVAGEGVGRVTKPGLAVPPGEPAINPVPRRMIREAVRAVTPRPVEIAVGIAGGAALAARTFNPRLGVEGGLSILGTSGRVRPFSLQAVRETVRCGLSVAAAAGVTAVVLVPGNLGRRAAHRLYSLAPEQAVEVANEWGYAADRLADFPFRAVLALGHPGKLAKLASGDWDTHSARSAPALDVLRAYAPAAHRASAAAAATVEALLTSLPAAAARTAADRAAAAVRDALAARTGCRLEVAVLFTDLAGREVGRAGRFRAWTPAGGTR
jgi:cobalt-precorrin-5B (C1)-methyltransferase